MRALARRHQSPGKTLQDEGVLDFDQGAAPICNVSSMPNFATIPGEYRVLGASCLAERLGHYIKLTDAEQQSLAGLEEQDRTCRRGTVVISEHEASRDLYVVRAGWLHASVVLGNGSRQIMRFLFQGGILGLAPLPFAFSPETVTPGPRVHPRPPPPLPPPSPRNPGPGPPAAPLAPFTRKKFSPLIGDHPRLGALILSLVVADRVTLSDRLASIGRTSARARVG